MFAQSRARKVLAVRDQGIELFFRREVHLGRLDASQGEKNRFSIFFPITSELMGHVHLESGYVRIRPMRQVATLMGTAAEAFTAKTQIDLGV